MFPFLILYCIVKINKILKLQSQIKTDGRIYVIATFRIDSCGLRDATTVPEKYKQNFDVSSEDPSSRS